MLNKHCKSALVISGVLSTVLLSGCKDDSLDLGDIDTTMKLEVNDLVLPLNIAPITFGDMVDLSSEECIEVINGEYVLLKNGSFDSEEIHIRDIKADAEHDFDQPDDLPIVARDGVNIPLTASDFPFYYSYNNVDEYIQDIYSGEVDVKLQFTISAKADNDGALPCVFENMTFSLPKGFYGKVNNFNGTDSITISPDYCPDEITVNDAAPNANGDYNLVFHVTSFDFTKIPGASLADRHFYLRTSFGLKNGNVRFTGGNDDAGTLKTSFHVSKMVLETFSGKIYYKIKDLNPENIELNDLPDVLTDPTTRIRLNNPQLYVKLTNPLGSKGVTASTGLDIKQIRQSAENEIEAVMPEKMQIEAVAGEQNFCLSPKEVENFYEPYQGAKRYEFTNLGNIIFGEGLPQGLKINFDQPQMNPSKVTNFTVGDAANLGTVHGEYTFYAPLELGDESHIYYKDEVTGWDLNGSDDNKLEIRTIALTADCVSDLPVAVTISIEPLDTEGKLIPNIQGEVNLGAFAKQPIEIDLNGDIVNLDGIRYTVTIDAGQDTSALKPSMSLKLNNLKVKLSGSYIIDNN
ncbi:MAG: hypothetical protein NC301_07260 [Bacteroides sp.]|nr:hypothetical protein [Bacteroides sp.]MCM1379967.1 hypothetical protein [Bacteroides sp.]MCM1446278.1 hypothetical protein [Prevotella sp.]